MNDPKRSIRLSMSGGGVRASAFHLGVLYWLAKLERLDEITVMSTVSGGSLAVALVFAASEMKWPTSQQYIERTFPLARARLTQTSLQGAIIRHALEHPIRSIRSRGSAFAAALEGTWGICGTMKDLPVVPRWLINATCYETGRNWRFSQTHIGDWKFGHNLSQAVPVSLATAASSAIPYLVGAVSLGVHENGWFEIDPATDSPIRPISRKLDRVSLWDGGVYENLGLEPMFKLGRPHAAGDNDVLIVSDASAHLADYSAKLTAKRAYLTSPRLFDVATEQTRALRSRMLMSEIGRGLNAAIIRLGRSHRYIAAQAGDSKLSERQSCETLGEEAVNAASSYPTDARQMSLTSFDLLARHGFEAADGTLTTYLPEAFPQTQPWPRTPPCIEKF